MGGDKGSFELVKGALSASARGGFKVTLFGNEEEIKSAVSQLEIKADYEIKHCDQVISMCDNPLSVIKDKKNCSMAMALSAAASGECDAVVSTGNSGALITGATFIVKRIAGVKRPAFAPVLPSASGAVMLLDAGANVEVRPEFLYQFGKMGSVYMEKVLGIKNPRVGLISNGKEEQKGTDLTKEARALMEKADYNFVGYIEGNDIMTGNCDVAVTDGYTGNVLLKTVEGMGKLVSARVRKMLTGNPLRIIGSLFMLKGIKTFKKEFDAKQYGGAMILGARVPVIKAHGSADSGAFETAVIQAAKAAKEGICNTIAESLSQEIAEKE